MSSRRARKRSPSSVSSEGSKRSRSYYDDADFEEEEEGYRLHIADVGLSVSKRDLERLFEKYGRLKEVWLAKAPPCFGFVVYHEKDDAEDAVKATNGITLHGSRIRVTFARPRTRGKGRRGFDPNMRCYQCGDKGHFSRDCPDTPYGYKRPPSRSPQPRRRPPPYRSSGGTRYSRRRRY
ncbi:serine/arginine-rich splicing factor 7-like isoform X1 [Schistocerca americana]|uniref:serine/arginine-rich splicing factor 7-like n=1 Tax=Schistocerca cancellata TaxID=274614 RepID=UPI001F4F7B86|nr:serine/arginine-rich splicing factor 7-like isoform X1 [Schistocerca americana]XP_047119654.1 serine/arginine-rich splicing factor 7-like isoform X1 [Schistocerca piceifrons]XP_049763574.1 serine/arginine-rich splicing factor 7-like [Schistocerca cancellata]XP_049789511.1 serine/arginine-rich splicing factor 7-like [Schistocerca nitens]XP_049833495.1 serine/arginine-rich splicing factor 7-like [Schistocerca gregaria]XP_049939769.1 serine/arginine-rich splicing factor 7-like [Schistocerca se